MTDTAETKLRSYVRAFLAQYFPRDDYPFGTTEYAGQTFKWLLSDSERRFRRQPSVEYGEDDISYRFNKHGFRAPEFSERKEFNVLVVGCSATAGIGLPAAETYPEILRQQLEQKLGKSVQVWNLGVGARGNDFMAMLLLSIVPQLKPDAVYVNWTVASQKLYVMSNHTHIGLGFFSYPADGNYDRFPAATRGIMRAHAHLNTVAENSICFAKSMLTVENLLRNHDVFYLHGAATNSPPGFEPEVFPAELLGVDHLLDPEIYTDLFMAPLDKSRDEFHCGRQANRDFAVRLADLFVSRYQLWCRNSNRNKPKIPRLVHPAPNVQAKINRHLAAPANQGSIASIDALRAAIPVAGIGPSRLAGLTPTKWLLSDSEERYLAEPSSDYGPDDIDYIFNTEGYRCPSFDNLADVNIIVAGSGETMGTGLPAEDTYSQILQDRLTAQLGKPVQVWNLGVHGESGDFLTRILLSAIPHLRPDLVYIYWPAIAGREFFTANGNRFSYFPRRTRNEDFSKYPRSLVNAIESLSSVSQIGQDLLRFGMNMALLREMTANFGAAFCYNGINRQVLRAFSEQQNENGLIDIPFPSLDKARDRFHPGKDSHRQYGETLATHFEPALRAKIV